MKSGILKIFLFSSFSQFIKISLATCIRVSIPTKSNVLNVADFGRPITGPVSKSISSIDKLYEFKL